MKPNCKIASKELRMAISAIHHAREEFELKNYPDSRRILNEALSHLYRGQLFAERAIEEEEKRYPGIDHKAEGWSLFIDPDKIKRGEAYLLTTTGASISYRVAYYEDGEWYDWNTDEALGLDEDETIYFKEI